MNLRLGRGRLLELWTGKKKDHYMTDHRWDVSFGAAVDRLSEDSIGNGRSSMRTGI